MVLAEAEHVEPHLIGERDLLDEVAHALVRADPLRTRLGADIRKGVEAKFHDRRVGRG